MRNALEAVKIVELGKLEVSNPLGVTALTGRMAVRACRHKCAM